jgi:uncharacterized protein (UPF0332 family)
MTSEIGELIKKARRSLNAAQLLFSQGDFDFASSRAYYSMFYMAEACLLSKNLSFSKHSGVLSGFSQYFIKTAVFDAKYSFMLRNAYSQRNISDYDAVLYIDEQTANALLEDSRDFIAVTEGYLEALQ